MTRYAIVDHGSLSVIRTYLPANYEANVLGTFDRRILISGEDNAGWTLDGYVIPRLASGLHFAREVDDLEREVLLEAAQVEDEMTVAELRGITAPGF